MTHSSNSQEFLRSIDEYQNSHWLEEVDYFCRNFLNARSSMIIDIGCGLGYVLQKLPRDNKRLVGIDINRHMVRHAKAKYSNDNCDFVVADANNIPFTSNVFDYAFIVEVIEHLTDPEKTLRECARILRPEGKLALTTPNGLYYRMLHHRSLASPYHVDEYPFWEIIRLITLAGFSLNRLQVSNRWPGKSILRALGKIPILAPLLPGRFYIGAKRR